MSAADPVSPRKPRWATLALVVAFHVVAILALARAFAPEFTAQVADQVIAVFNVTVATHEEPPETPPEPDTGSSAAAGKVAKPKPAKADERTLKVNPTDAATVAGEGTRPDSGASDAGAGSGASGEGSGTGSGASGTGQGNGIRPLEKLAGDINSAKDYPKKTRKLRIGQSVTILLTVGTDGLVKGCKVTVPSPDAEADRITCALATQRFRFRPAADARGNPIEGQYAWRQRWFY